MYCCSRRKRLCSKQLPDINFNQTCHHTYIHIYIYIYIIYTYNIETHNWSSLFSPLNYPLPIVYRDIAPPMTRTGNPLAIGIVVRNTLNTCISLVVTWRYVVSLKTICWYSALVNTTILPLPLRHNYNYYYHNTYQWSQRARAEKNGSRHITEICIFFLISISVISRVCYNNYDICRLELDTNKKYNM